MVSRLGPGSNAWHPPPFGGGCFLTKLSTIFGFVFCMFYSREKDKEIDEERYMDADPNWFPGKAEYTRP